MKLAIFGGTGQTGKLIVQQALKSHHSVRVLTRRPNQLSLDHSELTLLTGDVTMIDDVRETIAGQDAVLCVVGGSDLKDSTTRTRATRQIIAAMNESEVRQLVVCSVLGIGKSKNHLGMMSKFILSTLLKNPRRDHESQEELIGSCELDWVIVRPPRLIDGPQTGEYRVVGEDEVGFTGTQISRADLAHCMLRALNEPSWVGEAISISY